MRTLLLALSFVVILSACSRDQHDHPRNISAKALFELHCAECHNAKGTGNFLLGVPANNDSALLNLAMRHKVLQGSSKNAQMPVFEKMSVEEATKIVHYLRTLR